MFLDFLLRKFLPLIPACPVVASPDLWRAGVRPWSDRIAAMRSVNHALLQQGRPRFTSRIESIRDDLGLRAEAHVALGIDGPGGIPGDLPGMVVGVSDIAAEAAMGWRVRRAQHARSEEHTSELQSLMRISYAVFCLKKKNR